jgi:hypothetical protein
MDWILKRYLDELAISTQVFLVFLCMSLSKCWDGSQVPSSYCMPLMQPSQFKWIKIYLLTVEATKLLNFPNFTSTFRKSKFCRLCYQALTSYNLNVFTLIYPYQKDERALPGNLLAIRCSFSPQKSSVSHFSPIIFSALLLSFLTFSLFGFKA